MLRSVGFSRWLLATLTLASTTLAPALARPAAAQVLGDPRFVTLLTVEQTMLDLTNADRAANGLPALELDPETMLIARERAARQLGTQALSHYDASGELAFVHMLAEARLGYRLAGENLARAGASDGDVSGRVEKALMDSPTHRENILDKQFDRVAIGAAIDASGQLALAEIFRGAD